MPAVTSKRQYPGVTYPADLLGSVIGNPAAGTVSLRTKVTESKGNTSEMTVIRAYAIG
jgi:hypothetical protein